MMASRRAPEQPDGALAFFGGRRVTRSKKAGDLTTKHNWEACIFNVQMDLLTIVNTCACVIHCTIHTVPRIYNAVPETTIHL